MFLENINNGAPDSLIPSGRLNDGLRRDEIYFINAQESLKNRNMANTVFFNYTGHQGSVAAALAQRGVPSSWNLTLSERIADQLQDWVPFITSHKVNTRLNSHGVILEPSHALGLDGNGKINISQLPNPETLKKQGITTIAIFTEDKFGVNIDLQGFMTRAPNREFAEYLSTLQQSGLVIHFIGLEYME
jgi:hypothetical protein